MWGSSQWYDCTFSSEAGATPHKKRESSFSSDHRRKEGPASAVGSKRGHTTGAQRAQLQQWQAGATPQEKGESRLSSEKGEQRVRAPGMSIGKRDTWHMPGKGGKGESEGRLGRG